MNGIVFLVLSSGPLFLVYGKATEFCMLVFVFCIFAEFIYVWKSLLEESLGCSNYWVISSAQREMTLLALKRRDLSWLLALSMLCYDATGDPH